MAEPEKLIDTAQPSGEPAAVASQESTSQTSYFDSEESLRSRINELTAIADGHGSSEDATKALRELDDIEKFLQDPERRKPASVSEAVADPDVAAEPAGEVKKFHVQWKNQRIERDDGNNLLGHKSTGDLKAAYVKEQLRSEELANRLREAEERLKSQPSQPAQPKPAEPPAPIPRSAPSAPARQRPTPPQRPRLSTNEPALYSEEDLKAIEDYEQKRSAFDVAIVDYLDYVAQRPAQVDPTILEKLSGIEKKQQSADEIIQQTRLERQRLEAEKEDQAHWKRFSDFHEKHPIFKTETPLPELNRKMVVWMERVAEANGLSAPVGAEAGSEEMQSYIDKRADVLEKYFAGDPSVVKNTEGLPPPEEHDVYFRNFELYNALAYYKAQGILGEKATLEDAYLRRKLDSGDLAGDIEKVRTAERVNAVTEFSNNIENIQQQAAGVDPASSAGGPDITQFGVPLEDMKWFASIKGDALQRLETKDPEKFKKWMAIADRVEKVALR